MTLIIVSIIVVLLLAVTAYYVTNYNSTVIRELESNPNGERAQRVMLITFSNGRQIPVNYLRENDTVFAASDFSWWKTIEENGSPVQLHIKGEVLAGNAIVSTDEEYTYEVFQRLRPDAPTWASRLVGARLVVITLI